MPQTPPFSYFDKDNASEFKFIKSLSQKHKETLKSVPVIQDPAECRNISTGKCLLGSFSLYNELIVYYKDPNSSKPKAVLDITWATIQLCPSSQNNPGFLLTKNGSSYHFTFDKETTVNFWINALRPLCIMTNFHQEYKGIRTLGKGGFARVYLVRSKTTGQQFAAKAFSKQPKNIFERLNNKDSLINEIEILRSLDHSHVINLHEVQETKNTVYLIMEYVEGKTLAEVLTNPNFKKSYSEAQIMYLVHSLLDALAYLASKGIMHRDLKPANILMEKGGKIKLIDFGLAENVNAPKNIFQKCGTAGYIAPEVFKFDSKNPLTYYNQSCDMFSVGCILFYMLFGHPLFEGSGQPQIFQKNKEFDNVKILYRLLEEASSNPKTNQESINLLLELLQVNPKKRITAGDAFVHPYFQPIIRRFVKFASSKEIIFSPTATLNLKIEDIRYRDHQRIYSFKEDINPFYGRETTAYEENSFCLEVDNKDEKSSSDEPGEVSNENCFNKSHFEKYFDGSQRKHPSKMLFDTQLKPLESASGKCW